MSAPPAGLPSVPPRPASDLDQLATQIASLRADVRQTATASEDAIRQEADDRSMITRVVIYVFGASIGATLLVVLGVALASGVYDKVGDTVVDLLKSVVLPIVTLVLGYYFGRAGKS